MWLYQRFDKLPVFLLFSGIVLLILLNTLRVRIQRGNYIIKINNILPITIATLESVVEYDQGMYIHDLFNIN